jgi:hypothetical protein
MLDYAFKIDPTRSPRNSPLAFGVLVVMIAVLVGFHGVTMVLSTVSLGASTERATKWHNAPPRNILTPAAKPSEPTVAAITTVPTATPAAPVAPSEFQGLAAAAKAKAQAEMDELEGEGAMEPPQRRRYRAPRPQRHKVY